MALILLQQQQTSPQPPPRNLLDLAHHSQLLQRGEMLPPPLITHKPKLSSASSGHAWQPQAKLCNAFFLQLTRSWLGTGRFFTQ